MLTIEIIYLSLHQNTITMLQENKEVKEISRSVLGLNAALEGLEGAEQIMQDVVTESIDSGTIKLSDKKSVKPDTKEEDAPEKDVQFNETEFVESLSKEDKDSFKNMDDSEKQKFIDSKSEPLEEEEEDSSDDVKNPLLKKVKEDKNDNIIDIKSFDDIKKQAKTSLGIDIKDGSDFTKIFKSVAKIRKDAQKVPDLEKQINDFNEIFEKMPPELLEAAKSFFNAEPNWADKVSKPFFDFSKPADKQDQKKLVNHYFPGKFTDADFEEEIKPAALDIAITASVDKYNNEKSKVEELSAKQVRDAGIRLKAKTESISGSLTSLKKAFPAMDAQDINTVKQILDSGDISSIFINKDGSYKPDAANRLMMALYGEEAIKTYVGKAIRKGENKATEDILSRGADKRKPSRNNGNGSNKESDEKVNKEIQGLTKGINRTKTY